MLSCGKQELWFIQNQAILIQQLTPQTQAYFKHSMLVLVSAIFYSETEKA